MSAIGTKRTFLFAPHMSAFGAKADIDRIAGMSATNPVLFRVSTLIAPQALG
jgi:hypothetical protein